MPTAAAPIDAMFDAIVLAGGTARRLGGADKPGLDVGGRTLLDRTLDAVDGAERIVVVGPERAGDRRVTWCREEPPGGGPVAAVAAGLEHVRAGIVVVVAADLPRLTPAVPLLVAAAARADAALLVDATGRVNHLAGAWRRAALAAALNSLVQVAGASMRALVAAADPTLVADDAGWGRDCDTWDDVRAARAEASARGCAGPGGDRP